VSLLDGIVGITSIFKNGAEKFTRQAFDFIGDGWTIVDNPVTGRTEIHLPDAGDSGPAPMVASFRSGVQGVSSAPIDGGGGALIWTPEINVGGFSVEEVEGDATLIAVPGNGVYRFNFNMEYGFHDDPAESSLGISLVQTAPTFGVRGLTYSKGISDTSTDPRTWNPTMLIEVTDYTEQRFAVMGDFGSHEYVYAFLNIERIVAT
jgi:hypothetical protein